MRRDGRGGFHRSRSITSEVERREALFASPRMTRRIALTRQVSASLPHCELTYLERQPIDLDRARQQHAAYEALLTSFGWHIIRAATLDEQPDAVFVED